MTTAHVATHNSARFWDVLVVTMSCPECNRDERMFTSSRCANYHADSEEHARAELNRMADKLNLAAKGEA
jgi:glutaredoxin